MSHNKRIIEQFSKQAVPFSEVKGHYNAIDTIIEMAHPSKKERVLDVACGTGIVSCEFAKHVSEVIGIDITQAMLDQAIKKRDEEGLKNIHFQIGDVEFLPYDDESFDIVFTRYSFHHFVDVEKVFNEMIRVCKPNGRVIVVDVALKPQHAEFYNRMERLRDPSHTKALTFDEFETLFSNLVLHYHQKSDYRVEIELETQLRASFPNVGDDEVLRTIFRNDVDKNNMGVETHLVGEDIYFSYPITIFTAKKY